MSQVTIILDVSVNARISSLVPIAVIVLLNTSSPNVPPAVLDSPTIQSVNVSALLPLIALVMLLLSMVSLKLLKMVKSVNALAKTAGTLLLEARHVVTSVLPTSTNPKIVVSAMLDTILILIVT
jgi:hypothetical protein